jgi:dGTP triphosphohydrolase
MPVDAADLAEALNHAVTPPDQKPPEHQFTFNILTVPTFLDDEIVAGFGAGFQERINQLFITIGFTNALAFGLPKKTSGNATACQIAYGAASLVYYTGALQYFANAMPNFASQCIVTSVACSKKEVDEDTMVRDATALYGWLSLCSIFNAGITLSLNLLPPDFTPPNFTPVLQNIFATVPEIIQQCDNLRIAAGAGQAVDSLASELMSKHKAVQKLCAELATTLDAVEPKVKALFTPLYPEPEYIDFQNYARRFTDAFAQIALIAIRVGPSDPAGFPAFWAAFDASVCQVFEAIAPIMRILRFRGEFEGSVSAARKAHAALSPALAQFLQLFLQVLPKCPTALNQRAQERAGHLFQGIQGMIAEYPSRLETLIAAMRKDRRFIVFQQVGSKSGSAITEAAKDAIESAAKIVIQLIRGGNQGEIYATIQQLGTQFQAFALFAQDFLAQATDAGLKTSIIQQKQLIERTMTLFLQGFQQYAQSGDNALWRTKAAILSTNLLLAFCALDTHPVLVKQLSNIRAVLQEQIVHFFPGNLKTLLEVLPQIQGRAQQLGPAGEAITAVYQMFVSTVQTSAGVFAQNANPNNPPCVIACMHENDKLECLLRAYGIALEDDKLPPELIQFAPPVQLYGFDTRYVSEVLRLAIQLNFKHAVAQLVEQLGPFLELTNQALATQGDAKYQQFVGYKDGVTKAAAATAEQLTHEPAHGVYDVDFVRTLLDSAQGVFRPLMGILSEFKDFLSQSTNSPALKTAVNGVNGTLQLLVQMIPYLQMMSYKYALDLPPLIGYLIKKSAADVERALQATAQALQTNPASILPAAGELVSDLLDLAHALDYIDKFRPEAAALRALAKEIEDLAASVAAGNLADIPKLIAAMQKALELTKKYAAEADNLVKAVEQDGVDATMAGPAPGGGKAAKLDPFGPGGALSGPIRQPNGQPYPGLNIDRLPQPSEIDKLFMDVMACPNEQLRGLLGQHVDDLKKAVDEFAKLFKDFQAKPTDPALLAQLNALADRIKWNQKAVEEGLKFNPQTATDQFVSDLLAKFAALANDPVKQRELAPEVLRNLAAWAGNNLRDPARALVQAAINDCAALIARDPAMGLAALDALGRSMMGDPRETTLELLEELKKAVAGGNVKDIAKANAKLQVADRITRALNGLSSALLDPQSVQSKIATAITGAVDKGLTKATPDLTKELNSLIAALSDLLIASEDTSALQDSEIQDKLGDCLQDVNALGGQLLQNLKHFTPALFPKIMKLVQQIQGKGSEAATLATVTAGRRQDMSSSLAGDLQDELAKLLNNLQALFDATSKVPDAADRNKQVRAVAKAQREISAGLGVIGDLVDEIAEAPASSAQPDPSDYKTRSNQLLGDVAKLSQLAVEPNAAVKAKLLPKLLSGLQVNLAGFKSSVQTVSTGTESAEDISGLLGDLSGLLSQLTDPAKLTLAKPAKGCFLISEIRRSVADALSTDIVPQPKAAALLPYRFAAPAIDAIDPRPVDQLKREVDAKVASSSAALQALLTALGNTKTPADKITARLSDFHKSLGDLIVPSEQMRASTWNPQCQGQLSLAHTKVIAAGVAAMEAARARLLGAEKWREALNAFTQAAKAGIDGTAAAAKATLEAAEADLKVTNEAEKGLIAAGRAVAAHRAKIDRFKVLAAEKKPIFGEGYVGCEVVDIAAPILTTAAALIEKAHQQTKFLLSKDPKLPNQSGLIKTANGLIESLDLTIVSAEACVNHDADALSKVQGACNLISAAAAQFLAESNQKTGSPELNQGMAKITESIQGMVKQLRAFAESADRSKSSAVQAEARAPRQLSKLIEKLDAEAKVVEARKALELAEQALKGLRQGK